MVNNESQFIWLRHVYFPALDHTGPLYPNVRCSALQCSNAKNEFFRRYRLTPKGTFGDVMESS